MVNLIVLFFFLKNHLLTKVTVRTDILVAMILPPTTANPVQSAWPRTPDLRFFMTSQEFTDLTSLRLMLSGPTLIFAPFLLDEVFSLCEILVIVLKKLNQQCTHLRHRLHTHLPWQRE